MRLAADDPRLIGGEIDLDVLTVGKRNLGTAEGATAALGEKHAGKAARPAWIDDIGMVRAEDEGARTIAAGPGKIERRTGEGDAAVGERDRERIAFADEAGDEGRGGRTRRPRRVCRSARCGRR